LKLKFLEKLSKKYKFTDARISQITQILNWSVFPTGSPICDICGLRVSAIHMFKRDILLIDTEFSGFDLKKHDLLQIAAVLLDKKTLKEKKSFNSYIKPKHWKKRDLASMRINGITWDMVKDAEPLEKVIRQFNSVFPHDVIQAFYVGYNDKRILLNAYEQAKVPWPFDYHYLELWGLFCPFMAIKNKLTSRKDFAGFGLESMISMFNIKPEGQLHDALTDCRIEAEVFRRVMKELR
jgi:DNA polymerase III epsilon subunit-like protein